jgi:hypothetical protein
MAARVAAPFPTTPEGELVELHDSISSYAARSRKWRHRLTSGVRSLGTVAAVVVTLALISGGLGIASAATGGAFILGKSNTETGTAKLSDSRGTPLSLSAPRNKAPLAVNRTVMVRNLNAQYIGGLSASAIKPVGGEGFTASNTSLPADVYTEVAATGLLSAGTYYATATAQVQVESGDSGALCLLTLNSDTNVPLQVGGESGGSFVQAAETVAVSVHTKDTLQEWCSILGSDGGSELQYAAITAIRVLSSSGTTPASAVAKAGGRG